MTPLMGSLRQKTKQALLNIPNGMAGIQSSLFYMRKFVNEYKINIIVRELALSLIKNLNQKDFKAELNALFNYVQNSIRYTLDINGVETIQTPVKTLEYGQGDCDDKAVLLATLLESIGHRTRFYAVGFQPKNISHVLLECNINGEWIALETTEPVPMGWTPPNVTTKRYA